MPQYFMAYASEIVTGFASSAISVSVLLNNPDSEFYAAMFEMIYL
jgi:hypothetical protein